MEEVGALAGVELALEAEDGVTSVLRTSAAADAGVDSEPCSILDAGRFRGEQDRW